MQGCVPGKSSVLEREALGSVDVQTYWKHEIIQKMQFVKLHVAKRLQQGKDDSLGEGSWR